MKKWNYSEPDYLDELVKYIGNNCQLSVQLIPDIKEFQDARYNQIYPEISDEFLGFLKGKLLPKNVKLNEDQLRILSLLSLCSKHDIAPFYSLVFRPSSAPDIRYNGPKLKETWGMDELEIFCTEPHQFSKVKKWYGIHFQEFINESVEGAKIAIKEFSNKGYEIANIKTELNPRIVTYDHYSDYFKSDLSIWLGGGKITIYNEVPEDFEFPTTKKELRDFFK